jgi:hypothetical protein
MNYLGFAADCLVVLVFGISAVSKLTGFAEFAGTARLLLLALAGPRHRPSYAATRRIAILVTVAESVVPVIVLIPVLNAAGHALAGVLLTGFGVAIAVAMHRGVRTACRCFGSSATPLGIRHIVRNAALLLVAITGVVNESTGDAAGRVVAAAAAALLAVVVVRLDDLIDLFTLQPRQGGA